MLIILKWSGRQDLNLQPLGPKPSALPSWAISRYIMVRSKGFEPLTFWFVAKHSIQLSYERMTQIFKWWLQRELNQRHKDFQSSALPTELWSQKKWRFRRESNSRSSAWQADVITATPRNQWLREMDLNQRPLGYEPSELPSCSIPRY